MHSFLSYESSDGVVRYRKIKKSKARKAKSRRWHFV